ncbi:unnamed protein product [Chrysoparadoxa australica]
MDKVKARIKDLNGMHNDLVTDKPPEIQVKGVTSFLKKTLGYQQEAAKEEPDLNDFAARALEVEKQAKAKELKRKIDELEEALVILAKSPDGPEAKMILVRIEAETATEGDASVSELKQLQEKIRVQREQAIKDKGAIEAAKQASEDEAREKEEAKLKAENDALIASKAASELGLDHIHERYEANKTLGSKVAAIKKKAQTHTTYGAGFGTEEAAVEAAIKARHRTKLGSVEGISSIAITIGSEESGKFGNAQSKLQSQGLPHHVKVTKGIGLRDVIFLWIRKSIDPEEYITDLSLTHGNPRSPLYKDLSVVGFEAFSHKLMRGEIGQEQPSLIIWGKKDGKSDGIGSVDVSYTMEDEKRLRALGYKPAGDNLSEYALADARIWIKMVTRGNEVVLPVKHILHEMEETRQMLVNHPDNSNLKAKMTKLEAKLVQAREMEEQKALDAENPLKYAIETYAMTANDIDLLINDFANMDTERTGFINLDQFFDYLEWPRNKFSDHIFHFLESTDDDGNVDFGDFVKVLCTYCLFGQSELLTYAYTVYDSTGRGYIFFEDLLELLNMLHKANTGQITRALREMDILPQGKVTHADFVSLSKRFPKMFFPVADMQMHMRSKFLGTQYWSRKMDKFKDTREAILTSTTGAAKKALAQEQRKKQIEAAKREARKAKEVTAKAANEAASFLKKKMENSKWMDKLLS